ncbi:MAG: FHA domain-containing protein [Acidimicrobiia bacterium]|nr:FHA domain-containing protein [Acidimicrobiia bacterium]MBV8983419.1 FHA domain-containing protein [Acidimicrobiia bacterium]
MPESLLTILKFCFLALLYLFFVRVVRAVWTEVTAAPPAPVAAPPPATGRRDRGAAKKSVAHLRVVEPAAQRGRTYDVADELTIGRAAGCQIPLDDSYASQLHARVFRRNGELLVEDLGSTNGTFLNRKKVNAAVPIRKGDRLQVGKTVLELTK